MILGIESSCDDSSLALMKTESLELVFYQKISQEKEHAKYGGVVPELAARLHTTALVEILKNIKPRLKEIKAIAVTNEPGLSVSLISGVTMAKSLSVALNLPLIAINHLIGHIYSLFLDKELVLPLGVLLVSGGHTMVLDIDDSGLVKLIAKSTDDSFGESFDKVAKMLSYGYPGGPIIEKLAKSGDSKRFDFTVPLKGSNRLEYSFSGLKNQVRIAIEKLDKDDYQSKLDIAASFQKTACNHIVDRLKKIFEIKQFKNFSIVGGASANLYLREEIEKLCHHNRTSLLLAPLEFCSDNAAMIARAGVDGYKKGRFISFEELQLHPTSDLNHFEI